MKKAISVLLALCLFCTAAAALAETTPAWDNMPQVVIEDEDITIDEAAFRGAWKPDVIFAGETPISQDELKAAYGMTIPAVRVEDGKIYYDIVNDKGETVEYGQVYTFDAGQIQFIDEDDRTAVLDLLEDGNLVMSRFLPQEGSEEVLCITAFMVRADA